MGRLYFIKNKEKIYIFLIVVFVLLLGVGYAFLNSRLSMQGKIAVRVKEDIRVTNYYLKSTTNGAKEINSEYKKKSIMTNISLPNIDSTIAYQGEITNIGTLAMVLDSISDLVGDNENIVYDISLKVGDLFYGNGEKYTFTVTFKYKDGLTEVPENTELNSTIGFEFKKKESVLAKGSYSTNTIFNKQLDKSKIESIEFLDYIEPSYEVVDKWDASDKKDGSVMAWTVLDEDTQLYKLYIGGINGVVANTDSSYAFNNFTKANSIIFNDNYDTSNATNMSYMFFSCIKLSELNVSNFDTSGVTNMRSMFNSCIALKELDVSNFDTHNVTDMAGMFSGYNNTGGDMKLEKLDLSNFDTSNVTNMSSIFFNCQNLTELKLTNFDTSKLTSMKSMFQNLRKLIELDLSSFDTSNVTDMSSMFNGCSSLISLNVTSFNTAKVINMSSMFLNCIKLSQLNVSNFDTSGVTNMRSMFNSCIALKELDVSNFDTHNVTDMAGMFSGYNNTGGDMKLEKLDLSNFDTSNVTNMSSIFFNCQNLTELKLTNFNTSKVTSMARMFSGCKRLTELNLSNFDTSNVTNISGMFAYCSSLNKLNLLKADFSNVTSSTSIFDNAKSGMNITVGSESSKEFISKLNTTANITVA